MDIRPRCFDKVTDLVRKDVNIPNPFTIDIGDEVDLNRISSEGVTIYPGSRIYGKDTVISSGCRIGYEGPATIDNCQLADKVELKGGYFTKSVFLDKSNMSLGAHVREGCILEEEAGGAHCVGLKQTILFPFVTLGSLINFCDCLMAGGTSRKDHSEVGSSYIHFNFTPDGDKTTPSLIGDVPRGVMLNQPPIFLGGQGGIIGPLRMGYGNVVAAGSVLRNDFPQDNRLIVGKTHSPKAIPLTPRAYANLHRIVGNNVLFLANLMALEEWYLRVRQPFLASREFGPLIFEGLLDKLRIARKERLKRLQVLSEKARLSPEDATRGRADAAGRREFSERFDRIEELFVRGAADADTAQYRDDFLSVFEKARGGSASDYIATIQGLAPQVSAKGVLWLQKIVDTFCQRAAAVMPSLTIFDK